MDREIYSQTQEKLHEISQMVAILPLEEFIAAINTAETLGPILDPTLFRNAQGNLATINAIAVEALRFQNALKKVYGWAPGPRER